MELKISAAMLLARSEVRSTRAGRDAERAIATDIARRYLDGERVTLEAVHSAEVRADAADRRYTDARRRLAEKRAELAPRFLAQQQPVADAMQSRLHDIADQLQDAITEARDVEEFAVANSLPVSPTLGSAARLTRMIRDLRSV